MERVYMIVSGLVQGVGFRYHTQTEATRLGLTGYVKNLPDGTVEIVAEGSSPAVTQLLEWSKQGPPAAQVKQVDITYGSANGEFARFAIER
ncbi:MAG: acylphosphatase [Leptolyngbya sp. SIOISBB]|nr:acylphosphatase [Leptolyngbya sp. SIOISBB]